MSKRFRFFWGKSYARVFEREDVMDVTIEDHNLVIAIATGEPDRYMKLTFQGDYDKVENAFNALWDWMDEEDV